MIKYFQVKKAEDKPYSKYGICHNNENHLVLVILIDAAFQQIAPRQRIRALMDLASFMALEGVRDYIYCITFNLHFIIPFMLTSTDVALSRARDFFVFRVEFI